MRATSVYVASAGAGTLATRGAARDRRAARPSWPLPLSVASPAPVSGGPLGPSVPGLLGLRAAADGDLGRRLQQRAVLPEEFGGHRELGLAEIAVGRQRRVGALRQRQFER